MEVLVKQKSDPGRQYIFTNVKEIYIGKIYNSSGDCIEHYYKLVDMSGESHDECWNVDKYDIYTKFEFHENVSEEVRKLVDEL